ncbi:Regulator of drug sensitivity [Lachnellula suecica]|uniref:Regulator of drug sensitivity n=1 Tax=Lachnellula suecica TaxID=602035 RepID=A0A8T9C976_9HELO|nr:Regulator of drug sensitivity [Lachnellula suecica]
MTMDSSTVKLAELLRHPDDLDKIPAMKLEYTRKKAAVDSQLRSGLKEQLEVTQSGMNGITDGQRTVQLIKEEMMKIDKLCAEAQNMIRDFPNINLVSQTHRNFSAVETMRKNLETFNDKLNDIEVMLDDDEKDKENMPNLLPLHYELTQLRNIRDDAMEQILRADDSSLQSTLEDYFARLDEVVGWFDEHIGDVALNLISIVKNSNNGLVVRFAVIIEAEEKSDKRVKALQEALKDHKEMAARFQSITDGAKTARGYKEKFLQAIQIHADQQILETKQAFLEDSSRLEKQLKWFFNDLNAVKVGMLPLMPKKWKIFQTYGKIYHTLMHDYLIGMIDDPETQSTDLLAILNWPEKYYTKMAKLGFKQDELSPHVIDGREGEMVRDFRNLIIKYLDQWLDRIFTTEKTDFVNRNVEGSNLDMDEYGYFRTKNLVDMWRMLREQLEAAANSGRLDVAEGVVDAMVLRLKSRQQAWQKMLDDESAKFYVDPELDGFQPLQDWLVATANDQIACIDDNEEEGRFAYLTSFRQKFEPLVSPQYLERADEEISNLRDGYVDLSTHCIAKFAQLIFAVDFRSVMPDFFTVKWYSTTAMKQMVVTFEEYLGDYKTVLHHSLLDILVEELADELLIRYLSSVKNKGAKFKRVDPYKDKIYNDVSTAFEFFNDNSYLSPDAADAIKQKWRVTEPFLQLIEADKSQVPEIFANFKMDYWDLQLSWVEGVLRARDDFDRSLLNAVKARAAQIDVVRGMETIMSKAPEPEVLKRKRSRPSNWWAASPAASTSTPPQQEESAPVPAPPPKAPEVPMQKDIQPISEREGLKRKRSRPSDWWAASPSTSQLQADPTPAQNGAGLSNSGSGKKAGQDAGSKGADAKSTKETRNESKGKALRAKRSSNADVELQGSKDSDEAGKKRRGRPAMSREEEAEQAQEAPKRRGRPPAPQSHETEEPAGPVKQGRRGRPSTTQAEVQEATEPAFKDNRGKSNRGRPSAGSVEQQSSTDKHTNRKKTAEKATGPDDEEENRGRRRTRRSDAAIEEQAPVAFSKKEVKGKRKRDSGVVIDVETATSAFGKARGPGRPAKTSTVEAEPRSSKSGKSSSSSSKKQGPVPTKSGAAKHGRVSNTEPVKEKRRSEKRKSVEKSQHDAPTSKRRRADEATQNDEERQSQQQDKQPKYQHIAAVTKNIAQNTIAAKWAPVTDNCVELIQQLLLDVQRPVVARLKEEHKRAQATTVVQMASRKLVRKISKGVPFPQSTRPQREDDFDFEKVLDHTRALEAQLTPALHANELLEDELSKEMTWLESEKTTLAELEANAKAAAASRKQAERKLHPLLQSEYLPMDEEDLGYTQSSAVAISRVLEQDSLQDIVQGLEGHMESMQGNLKQIEGVSEAISKSRAAVQATLFDHLDLTKFAARNYVGARSLRPNDDSATVPTRWTLLKHKLRCHGPERSQQWGGYQDRGLAPSLRVWQGHRYQETAQSEPWYVKAGTAAMLSLKQSQQSLTLERVPAACVYCRRSERPCARCIKRNIGHLCHDEPREPESATKKSKRQHSTSAQEDDDTAPDLPQTSIDGGISNSGGPSQDQSEESNLTLGTSALSQGAPLQLVQPSPVSGIQANALSNSSNQFIGYSSDWLGSQNQFQDMHNYHPSYMFNAPEVTNEYNLLNDFLNNSLLDDGALLPEDTSNFYSDQSGAMLPGGLNNTTGPQQSTSLGAPNNASGNSISRPASVIPTDKAREYYLQAADPTGNDAPEERMQRLLRAKYDAGMLKPFNYVKGYARLSAYMDGHMHATSKQKILRQLDRFRPKFREKVQLLTDIELIYVEMWFERSLMEYDRVFASMAIPACCWRRTGEIFRGNKEMAELVHVPIEKLRDGKIAIHEILSEESLVNYWEKFGAIAFDQTQKALLTSCSLKNPDDQSKDPTIKCCFSFTIRRDDHKIPSLIIGNFLPQEPTKH